MRMNMLSLDRDAFPFVEVNYRGEPPKFGESSEPWQPPVGDQLHLLSQHQFPGGEVQVAGGPAHLLPGSAPPLKSSEDSVGESVRSGDKANLLASTTSLPLDLTPGKGSWSYNSIVATAKAGLPPLHVPLEDLTPEPSERVVSGDAENSGNNGEKLPNTDLDKIKTDDSKIQRDIQDHPIGLKIFKQLIHTSSDYKKWLNQKSKFLEKIESSNLSESQIIESNESAALPGKFPHFPDRKNSIENDESLKRLDEDVPRPQRDIGTPKPSVPVYKEGDTLYRIKNGLVKDTSATKVMEKEPFAKVSKLLPRPLLITPSPHKNNGYVSPLYPKTTLSPVYTSPLPPLPPGYELVPISQLTSDHEVVPWEHLPKLMEKHNLTVKNIPLGPYHTTPKIKFTPTASPHSYTTPFAPYSKFPSPQPVFKSTPRPIFNTTLSSVYSQSSKPYSPVPTLFYGSTAKPFQKSTPGSFTASTLKPTPQPIFGSSVSPNFKTSPTPSHRSPTNKYNTPGLSAKLAPAKDLPGIIAPYMPPPVSQDVGGLFSTSVTDKNLYAPKHRFPISKTTTSKPQKPKSIHFGTHFSNSYSEKKSKFRYDPTISPLEISGSTPKKITTQKPAFTTTFHHLSSPKPVYTTKAPKTTHLSISYKVPSTPVYSSPTKPPAYPPSVNVAIDSRPVGAPTTLSPLHKSSQETTHIPVFYSTLKSQVPVVLNPKDKTLVIHAVDVQSTIPPPTQNPLSILPAPMPSALNPPNVLHPTYFDVSEPVNIPSSTPTPIRLRPTTPSPSRLKPAFRHHGYSTTQAGRHPPTHHGRHRARPTPPAVIRPRPTPPSLLESHSPTPKGITDIKSLPPSQSFPTRPKPTPFSKMNVPFKPSGEPVVQRKPTINDNQNHVKIANEPRDEQIPAFPPLRQSEIKTTRVAVLKPLKAIPSRSSLTEKSVVAKFPNFSEQTQSKEVESAQGGKNRYDSQNPTTVQPESRTKESGNKMRSSTENVIIRKKGRLKIRPPPSPTRTNFHPIPSAPITETSALPQARPNVPISENEFISIPSRLPGVLVNDDNNSNSKEERDMSILTNNNNGLWILEEKLNSSSDGVKEKRDSIPELTTVNPIITAKSRTWPAAVRNSVNRKVPAKENGSGALNTIQSTTFSTSRVETRSSTTPTTSKSNNKLTHPTLGKSSEVLQNLKELVNESIMVHNKGMSPNTLDLEETTNRAKINIDSADSADTDINEVAKKVRMRRRKLRQRAKALISVMENLGDKTEPFVVLPMHQVNPKLKFDVDEMFDPDKHPGVKRISAYDFEEMMKKNATITVADNKFSPVPPPVDQLMTSIEGLASSMDSLSESVKKSDVSTTEKVPADDTKETISRLQDEIEKLTKTLQALQLVPGERDDADELSFKNEDNQYYPRTETSDHVNRPGGLHNPINPETISEKVPSRADLAGLGYNKVSTEASSNLVQPSTSQRWLTDPQRSREPAVVTSRSPRPPHITSLPPYRGAERRRNDQIGNDPRISDSTAHDSLSPKVDAYENPDSEGILGLFETMSKLNTDTQHNFAVTKFSNPASNRYPVQIKEVTTDQQVDRGEFERYTEELEARERVMKLREQSEAALKRKEEERRYFAKMEEEKRKLEQIRKFEEVKKKEEEELEKLRKEADIQQYEEMKRKEEQRLAALQKEAEERKLAELKKFKELKQREEERIEKMRKKAELERYEEMKRKELKRLEMLRKEEERKLAEIKQYEEMKKQEEDRLEKLRKEAEQNRYEEMKKEEEKLRKEEEERKLAEIRKYEEIKQREEERLEKLRKEAEIKRYEELRRLEEEKLKKLREEAEERRLAEEQRIFEEKEEERRKTEDLARLRLENRQQKNRYENLQKQLREQQFNEMKKAEEDLRKQQREKLKIFNLEKLFDEEKYLHEAQKDLQTSPTERMMELRKKPVINPRRNSNPSPKLEENPGVAYASITIQDANRGQDYEVKGDIVKLKQSNNNNNDMMDGVQDHGVEYEYEYYEADPDDIQFPVSLPKPAYETNSEQFDINNLSNKDLLLKLLEQSNDFKNEEFLGQLKHIILENNKPVGSRDPAGRPTSSFGESGLGSGHGSVTLIDNKDNSVENSFTRSVDGGLWSPSKVRPGSLSFSEAEKGPVWPSANSLNPPSDSARGVKIVNNSFQPSKQVRFPANRRSDTGGGVGEISLVTGPERKAVTSISGFQDGSPSISGFQDGNPSYASYPQTDILSRVDVSSNQEFVVGTSLAMSGKLENEMMKMEQGNPSYINKGYGTASPVSSSGGPDADSSDVLSLRAALQRQQQAGHLGRPDNYILPTYTNDYGKSINYGEIYTDVRVEQDKKNLLTVPTDPNKMYIKQSNEAPTAEVIVYPMGQLLSPARQQEAQFLNSPVGGGIENRFPGAGGSGSLLLVDTMTASGSVVQPSVAAKPREQVPASVPDDAGAAEAPRGIFQTILRSAKDDLKIVGNVFKHLTGA